MTTAIFSRIARPASGLLLAFFFMAAAMPGGFQLHAERPGAAHGDAALLVRTFGCHEPSRAVLSATAEGLVNGRRQSVPLKLTTVAEGVYAVKQQWPAGGAWVLAVTGTYRGYVSSVLVEMGPDGRAAMKDAAGQEVRARILPRALTSADIEGALQKLTSNRAPGSRASRAG